MPLDPKLNKFTTADQVLAVYNFQNIIDGTGAAELYAFNSVADTTDSYGLSTSTLYSNDLNTQAVTTTDTTGWLKLIDLDFDLVFNTERTLKGFARGNIPLGGRTVTAAPNGWNTYAIIKLRHWDGTTETEIANTQTETLTGGGGAINVKESKMMNFAIDATVGTHFAAGETCRVTTEIWGARAVGSDNQNVGFGHDPKARADEDAVDGGIIVATDSTTYQINLPFEIR